MIHGTFMTLTKWLNTVNELLSENCRLAKTKIFRPKTI